MTIYTCSKTSYITFNAINLNIYIANFFVDCIVDLSVIFIDLYINIFINFVNDCSVISIDFSVNVLIYFINDCCVIAIDFIINILVDNSVVSFNLIIDSFINYGIVFVDFISNCIFDICDLIANMTF